MLAYGKNMPKKHAENNKFPVFGPELIKNCLQKKLPKFLKCLPKNKNLSCTPNPSIDWFWIVLQTGYHCVLFVFSVDPLWSRTGVGRNPMRQLQRQLLQAVAW